MAWSTRPEQRPVHLGTATEQTSAHHSATIPLMAEADGTSVQYCACGCGEPMINRRKDAKYWSDACRDRARYRQTKSGALNPLDGDPDDGQAARRAARCRDRPVLGRRDR